MNNSEGKVMLDPEEQLPAIQTETQSLVTRINTANITNKQEWDWAKEMVQAIVNPLLDRIDGIFGPGISYWKEKLDGIRAEKKAIYDPLESAKKLLISRMKTWELAEANRVRLENARLEHEQQEREKISTTPDPVNASLTPLPSFNPVPESATPKQEIQKTEGLKKNKKWKFEIRDYSANGMAKMDSNYLLPDLVKIRKLVAAMGPAAEEVVKNIVVSEDLTYRFDR